MFNKTSKRNRLITLIVVGFMIFSMILFTVAGVISSFGNSQPQNTSQTQTAGQSILKITKTNVINYEPTNVFAGMKTKNGSCFASSISAQWRTDAFRCTVGNEISDPCFLITSSTNLFCNPDFINPISSSSFLLQNTKPLPKIEVSSSTNSVMAILLQDGTYCTPFTGTRPFSSNGKIAYYGCNSKDPTEEYIFGDLNNSAPVWQGIIGSLSKSTSTFPPLAENLKIVSIETVWR